MSSKIRTVYLWQYYPQTIMRGFSTLGSCLRETCSGPPQTQSLPTEQEVFEGVREVPIQSLVLPGIPCLNSLVLLLGMCRPSLWVHFPKGRWILLLLGPQDSQATVWGGGGQSLDLLVGVNNVCVRPVWLWEGQKWKGKRVGCDGRLALFSIPYSGAELWGAWAF